MKRDRVVFKGLGLYFEGEGRPAMTVAYCATTLLILSLGAVCLGVPILVANGLALLGIQ